MKSNLEPSTQEVLAGLVERVTFHNAENGFCVLRAKARGHRDLVTVVGHAAIISAGEWITASGEWINDRAQCALRVGSASATAHAPRAAVAVARGLTLAEELLVGHRGLAGMGAGDVGDVSLVVGDANHQMAALAEPFANEPELLAEPCLAGHRIRPAPRSRGWPRSPSDDRSATPSWLSGCRTRPC